MQFRITLAWQWFPGPRASAESATCSAGFTYDIIDRSESVSATAQTATSFTRYCNSSGQLAVWNTVRCGLNSCLQSTRMITNLRRNNGCPRHFTLSDKNFFFHIHSYIASILVSTCGQKVVLSTFDRDNNKRYSIIDTEKAWRRFCMIFVYIVEKTWYFQCAAQIANRLYLLQMVLHRGATRKNLTTFFVCPSLWSHFPQFPPHSAQSFPSSRSLLPHFVPPLPGFTLPLYPPSFTLLMGVREVNREIFLKLLLLVDES